MDLRVLARARACMTRIAFVRHAETEWNRLGKLQGRSDIPIDAASRARLKTLRLDDSWRGAHWFTSPLLRAQQTAQALHGRPAEIAEALVETNWGDYEGLPIAAIKARIRADNLSPARGLDMRPPNGESARMVRQRLADWLANLSLNTDVVAVTHKGVMRCAISLATEWDMQTPCARTIDWGLPQVFLLARGRLQVACLNAKWG